MTEAYDVITVGGGLAGAALAKRLAENGMRVLVLEREVAFRDRVRGEQMHCWGVAEARTLLGRRYGEARVSSSWFQTGRAVVR